MDWLGANCSANSSISSFSAVIQREWTGALLERIGYDPTYRSPAWFIPLSDLQDLLEWIGGPVPGVEHKWALRKADYEEIRDEQETKREWYADHPRAEDDINIELYPPGEYAPLEAEIPPWSPEQELHQQYSDEECLGALILVADHVLNELVEFPKLSLSEYDDARWILDEPLSTGLLVNRFGSWEAAKEAAAIEYTQRTGRVTKPAAKAALRDVDPRTEGPLSVTEYDDLRDEPHPHGETIASRFGWNSLKDRWQLGSQIIA